MHEVPHYAILNPQQVAVHSYEFMNEWFLSENYIVRSEIYTENQVLRERGWNATPECNAWFSEPGTAPSALHLSSSLTRIWNCDLLLCLGSRV